MAESLFTIEVVKALFELRNDPIWIEKFDKAKNNPKMTNHLWGELAKEGNFDFLGDKAREKYNSIIKDYRKNLVLSKKTGEGKITWKYWSVIRNIVNVGKEIVPFAASDSNVEQADSSITEDLSTSNSEFNRDSAKREKKENINERLCKAVEEKNSIMKSYFESKIKENDLKTEVSSLKDDVSNMKDELSQVKNSANEILSVLKNLLDKK